MGTEARSSYLLTAVAGGFAVTFVRNETQQHSAALKIAGQNPVVLLPLNSRKLSPVCSGLSQFAPVCPVYTQSQKLAKFHGVKSGSRFFGSFEAISRVTVGRGKLRAATDGRMDIICQGEGGMAQVFSRFARNGHLEKLIRNKTSMTKSI